MIDPEDVTRFDRTRAELEEYWLFCLVVANKNARRQARALDALLSELPGATPFAKIAGAVERGDLGEVLRRHRLGQYRRLERAFAQSLSLDLETADLDALEAIHGVGFKTARYFLLHARRGVRCAVIDTHVLKHLRENGIAVPRTSPQSRRAYRALEEAFIALAETAGKSIAAYDLEIWTRYSRAGTGRERTKETP